MTTRKPSTHQPDDPLGLADLTAIEPAFDDWASIESALLSQADKKQRRQRAGGWLAVAASLVLIVGMVMRSTENGAPTDPVAADTATFDARLASDTSAGGRISAVRDTDNIVALIKLSQNMENQVKHLRQESASMPAESAIYVAELEDLIVQVDNELSFTPDSVDLWGQRVNLLLNLAQIYQQQWQIDYGRLAAL